MQYSKVGMSSLAWGADHNLAQWLGGANDRREWFHVLICSGIFSMQNNIVIDYVMLADTSELSSSAV